MIVKKMWGLFVRVQIGIFIFGFIIFAVCGAEGEGVVLMIIIGDIIAIICGAKGNSWRQENLLSRGFEQVDTVNAANSEGALALYLKRCGEYDITEPSQSTKHDIENASDKQDNIPDGCPICGYKFDPVALVKNEFKCPECKSALSVPGEDTTTEDKLHTNRPSVPKQESVSDTMECPMCAEVIKSKAIKCRFCGHQLAATI
jgi:predicted RNA-binding Zn-ribbon protein involved in translation (DUF1610 family)